MGKISPKEFVKRLDALCEEAGVKGAAIAYVHPAFSKETCLYRYPPCGPECKNTFECDAAVFAHASNMMLNVSDEAARHAKIEVKGIPGEED